MSQYLKCEKLDENTQKSGEKKLEDGCLVILSRLKVASMHAGGGNAWMKIMGIGDHGGKRKKERNEKG